LFEKNLNNTFTIKQNGAKFITMSKKEVLHKLKVACEVRKINPSRLAAEIGCSPSYINLLFSGHYRYEPSDAFIEAANEWLDRCWVCGKDWNKK